MKYEWIVEIDDDEGFHLEEAKWKQEVVRCKDCIHYWKNSPSDDVPVCLASSKDDAFCSEGERKENETIHG